MIIVTTLAELRNSMTSLARPVGFVPTMGYLHAGHLSLAERARQECASVVASIFVNPTQFGPTEDLEKYPRNLERDLALLDSGGVDVVWTPTVEVLYPAGFQTWVSVDDLALPLEGEVRPGHFRGVTTVVAKLFNAVGPQRAYFGQKDAQQVAVIRRMTRDLDFPIEVIVCPTVREGDGLAMSSRNSYLTAPERAAATVLYRALTAGQTVFMNGERQGERIRQTMREVIFAEPLARMQYVSCADPDSLRELGRVETKALLSMAVHVGKTRLIDNLVLG